MTDPPPQPDAPRNWGGDSGRTPPVWQEQTAPFGLGAEETDGATAADAGDGGDNLPRRFGDYELLEKLGEGGMGVVFKARQLSVDRLVALKLIRTDQLAQHLPEERTLAMSRFRNEIKAAAKIDSDHVVRVYDVGQLDGQSYYAMRLIRGGSLRDRLEKGPLEPLDAARYSEQLAGALVEAHAAGILHRDLKPHNVMLDEKTDRAMLTDFGLAKLAEGEGQLTATESIMGTPGYMSPEQTRDAARVTAASDIYGLGATLYHLLTGRPPFQAANPLATMVQVSTKEPISPRELNPDVPLDLETITLKCLEKEPAKRYRSIADVEEELARFRRGEPIQARPVSRLEHAWRWCKRNRLVTGLAAATFLALLAGIVVASLLAALANKNATLAARRASQLDDANDHLNQQIDVAKRNEATALREKRRAKQNLYVAHMNVVQKAWEAGDLETMRQLLDRHVPEPGEPDPRGFEWFYFNRLSQSDPFPIAPQQTAYTAIDFARGGDVIAMGDRQGHVALWSTNQRRQLARVREFSGPVAAVRFSPDGSQLVAAGEKRAVVWKVEQRAHTESEDVLEMGLAQRRIITEGEAVVTAALYSPNGGTLAIGNEGGELLLHSTRPAADNSQPRQPQRHRHESGITDLAFSPDGRLIAMAGAGGTARVIEAQSGQRKYDVGSHQGPVTAVGFSSDGRLLATGGQDRAIRIWDAETGRLREALTRSMAPVTSLRFASDDVFLAAGLANHKARLWELVPSGGSSDFIERVTLHGHKDVVADVAFSPGDGVLATASADGAVRLWESTTGRAIIPPGGIDPRYGPHGGYVFSVAFSPDGRTLATASGDLMASQWDVRQAKRRDRIQRPAHDETLYWLDYSPDGKTLATCSTNGRIKLWEAERGRLQKTLSTKDGAGVWFIHFSRDGRRLAAGKTNGSMDVWDLESHRLLHTCRGHEGPLWAVAFSPDGRLLATAAEDTNVKLWDAETGKELALLHGHRNIATSVVFSPDGKTLASSSSDSTIRLWDVATRRQLDVLTGHASMIFNLAFSPDGKTLASASWDHTVKLWNVQTGLDVATLHGHKATVYSVDFSPDGTRLASGSKDGTAIVWAAPRIER